MATTRPRSFDPEQNIDDLDRLILFNWWLIADGEHPAVSSPDVRRKIDGLLDRRLAMMGLATMPTANRLQWTVTD